MKCDLVVEVIPLYLYGELEPDTEEQIEAHVHACATCRKELDVQTRIHAALDRREPAAAQPMLSDCRRDLFDSIRRGPAPLRRSPLTRLVEVWGGMSQLARPLGALALVALGFFSSRIVDRGGATPTAGFLSEPMISTVRSVQQDPLGGVRIALDETRRRTVRGALSDGQIEGLLLVAARDQENAGLRVESMEFLKGRADSVVVRSALIQALMTDVNPGVRLKALDGLKGMTGDREVRKALAQVMQTDRNAGVRIQAIDLLVQQRGDSDLVGILQGLMAKEENNYVRLRCKNALEEMNASVGTF